MDSTSAESAAGAVCLKRKIGRTFPVHLASVADERTIGMIMASEAKIEPVPRRRRSEALHFLAGGLRHDEVSDARAEAIERMARSGGDAVRLWWSRRRRHCVAAAMVTESPGRVGMLFHSPADAPGVSVEALVDLVRGVSRAALNAGGVSFVQALLLPDSSADASALEKAGFELLAELVYLLLPLASVRQAGSAGEEEPARRNYGEFNEEELKEIIKLTYIDSMDCPLLSGRRDLDDVIAGHKAGGLFRPEAWHIIGCDGAPAGCILVNDHPTSRSADVVYMGVVPSQRGKGLSGRMLRRAAEDARKRGMETMTLAVDNGNTYARKVYAAEGFRERDHRLAYIMMRESDPVECGKVREL